MGLSASQKSLLQFIRESVKETGRPPSMREIGEELGIRSTNGVRYHLSVLEREGYILREGRVSRGIQLTEQGSKLGRSEGQIRLPVLGKVAAGKPLFAEENIEDILELDSKIVRSGTFGLRVQGHSMKDAGILEGDVAIVRSQETAGSGDIVVALIGEEATVKRYLPCNGGVVLKSENPEYKDIVLDPKSDEFRILGKVVGIIRESL